MGRRAKLEKVSFLIYLDYKEQFELLNDEELGKLLRAIMYYEETGKEANLDGMSKMAFSFIKTRLDWDREKYIEAINFVILTGLKRTDDRKGYTFKDSERIIADLRSFYHWVDEMISLDSLILPSSDLVFEVFQARKKAEMEYSKLGTPSIESIKELTMEDLYKFENQKSAEVVSGSVKEFGGEVIRFASKEVELGKRNLGATDLGLKYRKAVKENMDMPKCYGTTDFSYYDDFLSVFFSGKIKVSELAHYFEKNTELAKKIDNIKLESLEGDKKTAEEDSRPSDFE